MHFDLKRKENIFVVALVLIIVFGLGYSFAEDPLSSPYSSSEQINPGELKEETEGSQLQLGEKETTEKTVTNVVAFVYVHVTGAVSKPGLYTFSEGSRVADAVKVAVPTDKADLDYINLAEILCDQQQVYVPAKGENTGITSARVTAGAGVNSNAKSSSAGKMGKININSASLQELDSLPGIGPSYAQRIIDYRNGNGGFKSIEELKKVSGIGEKKFATIKDMITI